MRSKKPVFQIKYRTITYKRLMTVMQNLLSGGVLTDAETEKIKVSITCSKDICLVIDIYDQVTASKLGDKIFNKILSLTE